MWNDFWEWRRLVIAQVRFKPDHKAIEQELTAHYEDHYQDLLRFDYPEELARERTLQALGDPVEVGQALDKAHKPWLGWLWQASRYLMLTLAAAIVILCFCDNNGFDTLVRRTQAQLAWRSPPSYAERVEVNGSTLYLTPGEITEADGHIQADIHVWVEMEHLSDLGPDGLSYLEVRDDRGDLFSWRTRNEDGTWAETGYRTFEDMTDISWTRYQWTIRLHLDDRPEWAEVSYPYGGQDWTLRVEWRDGT